MSGRNTAFPVVISGPSGVGKTTIEERLVDADPVLVSSISVTTRPARDGETDEEDYFFLSRDEFEREKATGLVEWAEVHGEYYGTPRRFLEETLAAGRDVLLNIDVQGGISVKKAFPGAVMVFIFPPSFETLKERILKRGVDGERDLETRLENAVEEMKASVNYDYFVINDELDRAVADVQAVIGAERNRANRYEQGFVEGLSRRDPK